MVISHQKSIFQLTRVFDYQKIKMGTNTVQWFCNALKNVSKNKPKNATECGGDQIMYEPSL